MTTGSPRSLGSTMTVEAFAKAREQELAGVLVCPPDKSVTHRSVMFAAMAKGESRVLSPLMGADCRSTMGVFRALGCEIELKGDAVSVWSPGMEGWQSPLVPLDYGNSGTTARLLTGLFAARPGLFLSCFGDGSLSKRPMGRVVEPLRKVGATIYGRQNGHLLPMAIVGQQLEPGSHVVDKASAQVKSALILAGLSVEGRTTVRLPRGGRDHSEKMLKALGADVSVQFDGADEIITVNGPFQPRPGTFSVPGDPSSAAFFAVLAALGKGRLTITGMLQNPTRTGFLEVLQMMGAKLTLTSSQSDAGHLEPVVDLTIAGGEGSLRGVDTPPELAPAMIDEIPVLAVAAAFASGKSRFRGLSELRVKESDRLGKTLELVCAAGGRAETEGDDLIVHGGLTTTTPFTFDPDEDHRLAMAAAVAAKYARGGSCTVLDPACVAVSFPGFFDVLRGLG